MPSYFRIRSGGIVVIKIIVMYASLSLRGIYYMKVKFKANFLLIVIKVRFVSSKIKTSLI